MRSLRELRRARPAAGRDRLDKAKMIEAILEDHLGAPVQGFRLLDIGCGNGGISQYFSARNEVFGVDLSDRRFPSNHGFSFHVVSSEHLPFDTGTFDIVLSHHVIEHVADQALHLDEIRRVLKSTGICYLATPNKTSPVMPGHVGNDQVLHYRKMAPLFERHGFRVREYGHRVLMQPERFHSQLRAGRFVPPRAARLLRPLYPSHMFVLTRAP